MIEAVIQYALSIGFDVLNLEFSPIRGPEGNIEYLAENEIGIACVLPSRIHPYFRPKALCIEHDTMDTTFRSMYQGYMLIFLQEKNVVTCCCHNVLRGLINHWIP